MLVWSFVEDLAHAMVVCFMLPNANRGLEYRSNLAQEFLVAYYQERKLSRKEILSLPYMLRTVAARVVIRAHKASITGNREVMPNEELEHCTRGLARCTTTGNMDAPLEMEGRLRAQRRNSSRLGRTRGPVGAGRTRSTPKDQG
jgi:hypothetical protein